MFEIEERAFGKISEYYLHNKSTGEFVSIFPEIGATINQLCLLKNKQLHPILVGSDSYENLLSEGLTNYKGSFLFPFPNRVQHGKYTFEQIEYSLPINLKEEGNALHGLFFDKPFQVVSKQTNATSATLVLAYTTTGFEQGYPFKVEVELTIKFSIDGLTCSTKITNKDDKIIPIGTGWHPYFQTGTPIDKCNLYLPVDKRFEVDEKMIPTGMTEVDNRFSKLIAIGQVNFDHGFEVESTGHKTVETILEDPIKNLRVVVWQEVGKAKYNFLQVYIPPNRKSIAIEPMSCLADAFNNKMGLISLLPLENCVLTFGIKLE